MTTPTVVLVSLLLATPVVIFWLWLVIVPFCVAKHCPEECWCDMGGYFVDCSNKSPHNIPLVYLTHVQKLVLNDNNITSLKNDSLISKRLTELDILLLERNGLQTIEVGAFNGLTKLTYLSMRGNGIGKITKGTFEMLTGLEYLGLDYNKIERLDVDVFLGLINLQRVNMEGNELMSLHPDIFVGLPKLERLYLGANKGLQIPTDRHFITSHSLKYLDLHKCNIISVSVETFAKISALETLDLSHNNLKRIDISILRSLPHLSALHLYGNPLRCDCQLKEEWLWGQDHNIGTYYYNILQTCYPTYVKDLRGWVLNDFQCEQDNISNKFEYDKNLYLIRDQLVLHAFRTIGIEIILLLLLIIFGTTANVIIVIIITCNKDMRTVPNMYILNLAISDTIFLTLATASNIGILLYGFGIINEQLCTSSSYLVQFSAGLTSYSVTLLSIQRNIMIVNPFHDRVSSQPTWCVTVATICGVWIVAALFSIPTALSNLNCFDDSKEDNYGAYMKRVTTFDLMAFCVIPLFVTAFSYIMAARHLAKSADLMSEGTQNPQLKARKNIAWFILGLTVVFVISYVPVYAIMIYFNLNLPLNFMPLVIKGVEGSDLNVFVEILGFACLFVTNSALNPVALFCTSSTFRKHLKRYLCCCCKTNSPPTDIELQRRNRV